MYGTGNWRQIIYIYIYEIVHGRYPDWHVIIRTKIVFIQQSCNCHNMLPVCCRNRHRYYQCHDSTHLTYQKQTVTLQISFSNTSLQLKAHKMYEQYHHYSSVYFIVEFTAVPFQYSSSALIQINAILRLDASKLHENFDEISNPFKVAIGKISWQAKHYLSLYIMWNHIIHMYTLFSVHKLYVCMMTSSNGNIFRVTGHLCGVPGEIPAQRPVTRSFDVFFHPRLNKRLSKQS